MSLFKDIHKNANKLEESANPFEIKDINSIDSVKAILESSEGQCGGRRGKPENEEELGFTKQQMSDMKKLAKQYLDGTVSVAKGEDIPKMLGDDLEMLEYGPKEVEKMIPAIVKMINTKAK